MNFLKRAFTTMGLSLLLLWMIGVGGPPAGRGFAWLVGAVGVISMWIAAKAPLSFSKRNQVATALALGLVLGGSALLSISFGNSPWVAGWALLFAVGYFTTGAVCFFQQTLSKRRTGYLDGSVQASDPSARFKKSA